MAYAAILQKTWISGASSLVPTWVDPAVAITVEWDIDSGNIAPADIVITNATSTEPIIEVTPRVTLGGVGPTSRWIHWHFKVGNAAGKRPIFKVDVSGRYLSGYAAGWLPQVTEDYAAWAPAPSRTITADIAEFQFTEAFVSNDAYIADHQVYRVADFATLAATLAADASGLVSVSSGANAGGVIGTSPAENDELSRAVGGHEIYGFVLGDSSATTHGGPKRWMIVDCGVHAGEILDGWPLEGIIDFYLNGVGANADRLRSNWRIGVYFALTPNGRYGGNWRGNFRDTEDPNRDWAGTGSFSLAESAIVRDAILADLGGATEKIGVSLHTAASLSIVENVFRSTAISDATIQNAWLNALDTADGSAWNRVNTNIPESVTGWHASRGADVSVALEFGTRATATVARYQQTGQRFLEATAIVDAAGLFATTITADGVVAGTAGVGMSAEVVSFASMIAAASHSTSMQGQAAAESGFSAGAQHGSTAQGQAAAQGALSIQGQAGSTITARADFLASITASGSHGQTMTGTVAAAAEITADMLVSATVGATASAHAQALASMVAGVQGGTTMSTGTQIDANMSLSANAGVGMTATISANAEIAAAAQGSVAASGQAQAQADMQVSIQAATALIAQAATQAGLSVGHIHNVTISATSISGDLVTPDSRTYRVTLELRTFTVPAEDRTFTVH